MDSHTSPWFDLRTNPCSELCSPVRPKGQTRLHLGGARPPDCLQEISRSLMEKHIPVCELRLLWEVLALHTWEKSDIPEDPITDPTQTLS